MRQSLQGQGFVLHAWMWGNVVYLVCGCSMSDILLLYIVWHSHHVICKNLLVWCTEDCNITGNTSAATDKLSCQVLCNGWCHWRVCASFSSCNSRQNCCSPLVGTWAKLCRIWGRCPGKNCPGSNHVKLNRRMFKVHVSTRWLPALDRCAL